MDDILKLLEEIKAENFKIVGNKILATKIEIGGKPRGLFNNIKYDFYVGELQANYIPSCIKSCDDLVLYVGDSFDGYLPRIKDTCLISSNVSVTKPIILNNISCNTLSLKRNNFSGKVKANNVALGSFGDLTLVDNLELVGFGDKSQVLSKSITLEGFLKISNFSFLHFDSTSSFKSNSTIEISNCGLFNLSSNRSEYDASILNLSDVKTLVVYHRFDKECLLEADKVIFTGESLDSMYESSRCKSLFLCKECEIEGKTYSKENTLDNQFPNIIFK